MGRVDYPVSSVGLVNETSSIMNSNSGREMPAAFGSGSGKNRFAESMAAKAAYSARASRLATEKDATERKRIAEASNFVSEQAYPSLGQSKAKAVPPLNFKKAVAEAVALPPIPTPIISKPVSSTKHIPTHCYDDGPEDYDGPEEGDEDEEEDAGEFNAHLASNRRRGDKGVW